MTTIDGTPGRWRPWLPGTTKAPAEALAAAWGCTVPEAVAQAVLDAHAKLSTPVDAGASQPGRPDVDPGQGEAQPPAPTTYPSTDEMVEVLRGLATYVEDEWSGTVAAEPLGLVGQARAIADAVACAPKIGGGAGSGNAPEPDAEGRAAVAAPACDTPTDDHDAVEAQLASDLAASEMALARGEYDPDDPTVVVARRIPWTPSTTLPTACPTCGERSEHEVCP